MFPLKKITLEFIKLSSLRMIRKYASLIMLFVPPALFLILVLAFIDHPHLKVTDHFPYFPVQFYLIGFFGIVATVGGVLDWNFHRTVLNMKMSKKERDMEAAALGLGGVPMFVFMFMAMLSDQKELFMIPIIVILVYTVVAICYDEFVFHRVRCGKRENLYHRLLVFGNGLAWLAWFQFIFV